MKEKVIEIVKKRDNKVNRSVKLKQEIEGCLLQGDNSAIKFTLLLVRRTNRSEREQGEPFGNF